jgi:hypothetical protein
MGAALADDAAAEIDRALRIPLVAVTRHVDHDRRRE